LSRHAVNSQTSQFTELKGGYMLNVKFFYKTFAKNQFSVLLNT